MQARFVGFYKVHGFDVAYFRQSNATGACRRVKEYDPLTKKLSLEVETDNHPQVYLDYAYSNLGLQPNGEVTARQFGVMEFFSETPPVFVPA